MQKKILLTTLAAIAALGATNAANADYSTPDQYGVVSSVFNPAYRPMQHDWALQTGASFRTGSNEAGTSMTKFGSGDFEVDDFSIKYGILDELFVSVDVYANTFGVNPYTGAFAIGGFANPEIGVNWQIFRPAKSFALDLIGKYGAAWTKYAGTNERIGMNNLQAGARIYGDEGRFQWALQGLAQMAFANDNTDWLTDSSTLWNALIKAEVEFEFMQRAGIKLEGNYNIYNLNSGSGEHTLQTWNVLGGIIYDIMPHAAVMPYVSYNLKSEHNGSLPNNYWQLGAKFGVQF